METGVSIGFRQRAVLAVVILTLGYVGEVSAASIISGDGNELGKIQIEAPDMPGHGILVDATLQTISVAPNWQPNNPGGLGAKWISYADTGYMGSVLAASPWGDKHNTVMQVRETISAQAGDHLWLDVWSPYTSDVQLRYPTGDFSGGPLTTLIQPNFSLTGERETIDYTFTTSGEFYLFFSVFQVGTGPFGLLYSGEVGDVRPSAVPDSGSLNLLFLGVVAGMVLLRRERQTASTATSTT